MTPLRELLKSRSPQLAQDAISLIDNVLPLLWHSLSSFPEGTKHTPEHTTQVELIASMLLGNGLDAALSDDEVFLLLLACHFHDLGMAAPDCQNRDAIGREQARREHAITIGDRIRSEWQQIGFRDQIIADALAEICRGHRPNRDDRGIATWDDIDRHRILRPSCAVRLRLVSAIIYAVDELHLGADRAPRREEDWLQLEGDESRRHWRRHQAVTGPAMLNGEIAFDVAISTLGFEDDLRRSVFQKAFGAVRDMNAELSREGIGDVVPNCRLNWKRDDLWTMLIVEIASDMVLRTRIELEDVVIQRFEKAVTRFINLAPLCTEEPTPSEVKLRIRRKIDDMIRKQSLEQKLMDPVAKYQLATTPRKGGEHVKVMRDADEVDSLFQGTLDAQHEFALFTSAFGAEYINATVKPHITAVFGVIFSAEPKASAFNVILQKSPSACHMINALRRGPNALVQRDGLLLTLLAGIFHDLVRTPDLILERDLREAIKEFCSILNDRTRYLFRLVRELSLANGLTLEQIGGMLTQSKEMIADDVSASPSIVPSEIKLTQSVPTNQPSCFFGRLIVVGRRLNETIEILNSPDIPLTVKTGQQQFDGRPIHSVAVGPGKSHPSAFNVRAELDCDLESRIGTLRCRKLARLDEEAPLIVELSPPHAGNVGKTSVTFHFPSARVSTLNAMRAFNSMNQNGSMELRVEIEDVGRLISQHVEPGEGLQFPQLFNAELAGRLIALSPDMPLPWFLSKEQQSKLCEVSPDDLPSAFGEVLAECKAELFEVTSVTLRIATAKGDDRREEFLGFLPHGVHFDAPTISTGGTISQEDLVSQWTKMEMLFQCEFKCLDDYAVVANQVREWCGDLSKPFPFEFSMDDKDFHTCKTAVSLIHLPKRDRVTYIERPVFVRLRPLTDLEQREVERDYWKAIGDSARFDLVSEIILEMTDEASSK